MSTTDDTARIAAQVALEAVVNDPDAYDQDTIDLVLDHAEDMGVERFYLALCRELASDFEGRE